MAKDRTGLCPFSWIQVTKPAGCLSGLLGGGEKTVSEPQPCMGGSCQLWNAQAGDCGLVAPKH